MLVELVIGLVLFEILYRRLNRVLDELMVNFPW